MLALKKPILLMAAQTTASGNNTDTFGYAITNAGHKGLMLFSGRTSDTGTCTADFYLQALRPGGAEATDADWIDCTLALVAQYANDATGYRIGVLYPALTAQDTGSDVHVATTVTHTSGVLPQKYRLRLRSGGTTVTNTIPEIWGVELP